MRIVPLIAEHDTWISLDPVIGCPAKCEYCYLHGLGLTAHKAETRVSPERLIIELRARFGEEGPRWAGNRRLPMAMCIGNYTDQFMTRAGLEFLLAYLPLHAKNFPKHPLCIVTKSRLRAQDVQQLDRVGHRVLVFLSQSFIRSTCLHSGLEKGPTSRPSDTIDNALLLAQSRNLTPLHFWRPLSPVTLPDLETAIRQIEPLQRAGVWASVAIGLKCGATICTGSTELRALFGGAELPKGGQYLDALVEKRALTAGHKIGHPVYRHTSCAVAYALN